MILFRLIGYVLVECLMLAVGIFIGIKYSSIGHDKLEYIGNKTSVVIEKVCHVMIELPKGLASH